jgi:RNA polymerase sigma factor (sigma-70 family)
MEDFEKNDDFDLIEWIECGGDYPAEARKACEILYKRHKEPLFRLLRKILGKRGVKDDEIVDLVHDTFYKIYSRRKSCKRRDTNVSNAFLYWLVTIAENLYNDLPDDQTEVFSDYDGVEAQDDSGSQAKSQRIVGTNPNSDDEVFPREEVVIDYIQAMPERDREIILSYYDHYIPGKNTPHKVLEELASRHNTTIDYIRVLRTRLIKKIKSELSDKVLIESKTTRK